MIRRHRRPAVLLVAGLLATALSACGDDTGADDALSGFAAVEISGEPGSEPTVEWNGEMTAGNANSMVLTEGDGPAIEQGDQAIVNYWIGNGFIQDKTFSTYDEGGSGELLTLSNDFSPVFLEAIEGQTIGSRVAVVASASEAFGEVGNPQLGIGNEDSVLLIADLTSGVLDAPAGAPGDKPDWLPGLFQTDGVPTKLGFDKTPEPTDELRVATTIVGEGPEVESGQTIVIDYLGQVYGGKQPFDESFSGEPIGRPIGVGGFIEGWDEGLVGQTVGSRVYLAIPPELGYGKKGNEQAGITGTDTLYFVIDILGAG